MIIHMKLNVGIALNEEKSLYVCAWFIYFFPHYYHC